MRAEEIVVKCGSNSVAWWPVGEGCMTTESSRSVAEGSGLEWPQTAGWPRGVYTDLARPIPLGQPAPRPWASGGGGPASRPRLREQCSSRPVPDDDDILDDEDEDEDGDAFDDDFDLDDDTDE